MVICLQGFGPESTANNIAMAMQQGLTSRPEHQGKNGLGVPLSCLLYELYSYSFFREETLFKGVYRVGAYISLKNSC